MDIKNLLIDKEVTVKEVFLLIEKFKQKIFYVIEDKKLIGAVSDGDIRRFLLKGGNMTEKVENISNKNPVYIYENNIKNAKKVMIERSVGSIPVINFNNEVVSVLFYNNEIAESKEKIEVPVVIMAGGLGTRLYPYTKILPKPLIPIKDTPITEHIINRFNKCGCNKFFLIVNHKKNMIKAYFDCIEKKYELNYIDEEKPLGTGGGLSLLRDKLKEDDFFFTNCDILIDSNYINMYKYHKENQNMVTIVASMKETNIPYGVIQVKDDSLYDGMLEKPKYKFLINTGLYIVNKKVLDEIKDDESIGFPDIIDRCRVKGYKIGVYRIEEKAFMDMGQFEELEEMKKELEK